MRDKFARLLSVLKPKSNKPSKILAAIIILSCATLGVHTIIGSHADTNDSLTNTSDVTAYGSMASSSTVTSISTGSFSAATPISQYDYGSNQIWYDNGYGSTNPDTQQAYPAVVSDAKDMGLTIIRYPGGNPSDLFHWENAIGSQASRKSNLIDGGFYPPDAVVPSSYGPDEYGSFLNQIGAAGDVTVNFDTGTAAEAADWVCYMTSPLNNAHDPACNSWAAERAANGHSAPYSIPYWEVGNEPNVGQYWRSGTVVSSPGNCQTGDFACLYVYGGTTKFTDQSLEYLPGQNTNNQVTQSTYYVADPPVVANTETVTVQIPVTSNESNSSDSNLSTASAWQEVPAATLAKSTLGAHEYTLDPASGAISFHVVEGSTALPTGSKVTISYESGEHQGFNQYYSEMKEADPSAHVCETYPTSGALSQLGKTNPYDCLVIHEYGIADGNNSTNYTADEFHDQAILSAGELNTKTQNFQASINQYAGSNAKNVQLVVTEYGIYNGDSPETADVESSSGQFPFETDYHRSLDLAVFSADMLKSMLDNGIALSEKHYLTSYNFSNAPGIQSSEDSHQFSGNAMIDTSNPTCTSTECAEPAYVMQPTAYVIEEFSKLLYNNLVSSSITSDPSITIPANVAGDSASISGSYKELSSVATTDGNGNEALLVINNTPNTYVQAQINPTLASYNEVNSWTLGAAGSDSFLSYNTPSDPNNVTLRTSSASFQRGALAASFPPSSVTVMRFSKVGGSVPPSGGGSGTTTTTVTPTIPTGLQATHATTTSVTLAWNPSTDSQGVLRGYNIDENGNHLTAIDNTGTSYTVTGLTPGTSYYFSVSAFNTNGQTSIPAPRIQVSTEAASTAPTAPTTVTPSIPTNLRATAETTSSVTIAWNPSTDSVGTMAGYNIIENAVHLTAISPSETSYTVTGLTTKTSYYFSVAAYNTTGQTSVPASRIQVTTK